VNTIEATTAAQSVKTASSRKPQWLSTVREAWGLGRIKLGVAIVVAMVLLATLGPLIAPYSPTQLVGAPFAGPSVKDWLGTDFLGRDVLSRVLCGGFTVIALSLAATLVGFVLGVGFGLVSGYARRWFDETIMRTMDVVLAFPSIVLVLVFVSILGPRLWLIVLLVGISHAPRIARVTRGATMEVAQLDFVKSSEALEESHVRILSFEILPNITSPLLVEFGLRMTYSIGIIAGLSFLGFGMQPPAADWGLMINENRIGISIQPWATAVPVILIAVLTIGVNLITDGLDRVLIGIDRDTGAQ
jgi:peptide/nickel transport system permease protein